MIAVSACLLGTRCRYDGEACPSSSVVSLGDGHTLVPVCPELLGGLEAPRLPNEIVTSERAVRVVDVEGNDLTAAFIEGARKTLELVRERGCVLAVLKGRSPSCGSGVIHDGTFSGTLVDGHGVTSRLLRSEGIRVIDEVRFEELLRISELRHPGCRPGLLAETSAECPALETQRLVLRPIGADDAEDVFSYAREPDVGLDAGWPPHRDIEDSLAFITRIACGPHVYGVFEKRDAGDGRRGTGPCIGSVGLIPDPHRQNVDGLMLGYALAKSAWGKGYMTEASREILRHGFEELGLSSVTVTHYTFNDRSRRVIEKCGFTFEGVMRGMEVGPDGLTRDAVLYSLTVDEWRSLQELDEILLAQ